MKSYKEVAESVFERRDKYIAEKKRKQKILKRNAFIGLSFCIILLISINIWNNNKIKNTTDFIQHSNSYDIIIDTNSESSYTTSKYSEMAIQTTTLSQSSVTTETTTISENLTINNFPVTKVLQTYNQPEKTSYTEEITNNYTSFTTTIQYISTSIQETSTTILNTTTSLPINTTQATVYITTSMPITTTMATTYTTTSSPINTIKTTIMATNLIYTTTETSTTTTTQTTSTTLPFQTTTTFLYEDYKE